jgi:D-alanine transaminase
MIVYLNGQYVDHSNALVSVDDRGFVFADGVYEVARVYEGVVFQMAPHMQRMRDGLRALRIREDAVAELPSIAERLLDVNELRTGDATVYIQITRGVAPRTHSFPSPEVMPTVYVLAKRFKNHPEKYFVDGITAVTVPDTRWSRCDIKSISLLPNILAKQQAVEAGAFEAWQVDDKGLVTEGTSTNAWIVTKDGVLVTRRADHDILNGITRQAVLRLTNSSGVAFEERSFTLEEAKAAREAFLTSSSGHVLPITRIDDQVIGDGKPGTVTRRLRGVYLDYIAA